MAFSDFTYPQVIQQFGLVWQTAEDLFATVPSATPSPNFQQTMSALSRLAVIVNTEKARSEWMIAPLLGEFWSRYHGQISLFSGADFQADVEAKLTGFCDFLVGRAPQQPQILAPVIVIFEAKKEDLDDGLGQCIAGMVGSQRFNARSGKAQESVYGCLTTGTEWRFLQLTGNTLVFDSTVYVLNQAERILGILTHIVGPPPT
jgi:hypothetical protein